MIYNPPMMIGGSVPKVRRAGVQSHAVKVVLTGTGFSILQDRTQVREHHRQVYRRSPPFHSETCWWFRCWLYPTKLLNWSLHSLQWSQHLKPGRGWCLDAPARACHPRSPERQAQETDLRIRCLVYFPELCKSPAAPVSKSKKMFGEVMRIDGLGRVSCESVRQRVENWAPDQGKTHVARVGS